MRIIYRFSWFEKKGKKKTKAVPVDKKDNNPSNSL